MTLTIAEVAKDFDGIVEGNGDAAITGIAGIHEAKSGDLTFVANVRYAHAAAETKASAVIVPMDWKRPCSATLIRAEHPNKAFAEACRRFACPPVEHEPGIHETAVIADDCMIGENVTIGPLCVVESGTRIGDRTVLFAGCMIGQNVTTGEDCKFHYGVKIREHVILGDRVIIQDGAVVGGDGFGYTVDQDGVRTKIPQAGTVEVGDDVEIGANATIDRARFGKTRIGQGVKIDNLVQVAHNVDIGDHAVLVAQVGIAGSCVVGERAILAGQAGIAGHLKIGEDAVIGAQGGVTKDVAPGTFVSGYPAMPHQQASRLHAHYKKLPDYKERLRDLEDRIQQLEEGE